MKNKIYLVLIILFLLCGSYFLYSRSENLSALSLLSGFFVLILLIYPFLFLFKDKQNVSEKQSEVVVEEDIGKLVNIYAEATRFPGHREYEGNASITEVKTGRKVEVLYSSEAFINKYGNPVNITFYFGKETFNLKGILSDELFKALPVQQMWIAHLLRFSICTSIILANMNANSEDMIDSINPLIWLIKPNIGKAESSFSIEFEDKLRRVIFEK